MNDTFFNLLMDQAYRNSMEELRIALFYQTVNTCEALRIDFLDLCACCYGWLCSSMIYLHDSTCEMLVTYFDFVLGGL